MWRYPLFLHPANFKINRSANQKLGIAAPIIASTLITPSFQVLLFRAANAPAKTPMAAATTCVRIARTKVVSHRSNRSFVTTCPVLNDFPKSPLATIP